MADTAEIEQMVEQLQLFALARRAFIHRGDQEGLDLANKLFDEIEKVAPGVKSRLLNTVTGCGIAFSWQTLANIKHRIRMELEAVEEHDEHDEKQLSK